jgi:hypothetical protein
MKKSLFAHLPIAVRMIPLSLGALLVSCGERPGGAQEDDDSDATTPARVLRETSSAPEEADPSEDPTSSDEQMTELRSKIDSQRQTVDDLQAAVEMERAKLKENPDYDQSFLMDTLDEQQGIKDAIESGEKRLEQMEK